MKNSLHWSADMTPAEWLEREADHRDRRLSCDVSLPLAQAENEFIAQLKTDHNCWGDCERPGVWNGSAVAHVYSEKGWALEDYHILSRGALDKDPPPGRCPA